MGIVARYTVYCDGPMCKKNLDIGPLKYTVNDLIKANAWKCVPIGSGTEVLCPGCYKEFLARQRGNITKPI